jgi:Uma2 family endonuclease
MTATVQTIEELILRQPDVRWELHEGRLREKPAMAFDHNDAMAKLGHFLLAQLDWSEYTVHVNAGHLKRLERTYYIPDVAVIPLALAAPFRGRFDRAEIYEHPLPLVVEVWSPSTGDYDVDTKVPEYRARGDLEIWRLHPYERTLITWHRQEDGTYVETRYTGGLVRPHGLPDVEIDLAALFLPPS